MTEVPMQEEAGTRVPVALLEDIEMHLMRLHSYFRPDLEPMQSVTDSLRVDTEELLNRVSVALGYKRPPDPLSDQDIAYRALTLGAVNAALLDAPGAQMTAVNPAEGWFDYTQSGRDWRLRIEGR